eukprot:12908487-Prorocentrum_lima.AAC.1
MAITTQAKDAHTSDLGRTDERKRAKTRRMNTVPKANPPTAKRTPTTTQNMVKNVKLKTGPPTKAGHLNIVTPGSIRAIKTTQQMEARTTNVRMSP